MSNTVTSRIIKNMRSYRGKFRYSNAWVKPALKTLIRRGSGDCSDFTYAFFGAEGYKLGAMANDQARNGTEVASWRGRRGIGVAAYNKIYKRVRQGDIICMDLVGRGLYTHVETIVADRSGNSIGHGSGMGPKEQNLGVSWLLPSAYAFTIRRIVPENAESPGKHSSAYKGPSIVLYLKSVGKASSFAARRELAKKHGIKNYVGTAQQNTRLLKKVRGF